MFTYADVFSYERDIEICKCINIGRDAFTHAELYSHV